MERKWKKIQLEKFVVLFHQIGERTTDFKTTKDTRTKKRAERAAPLAGFRERGALINHGVKMRVRDYVCFIARARLCAFYSDQFAR